MRTTTLVPGCGGKVDGDEQSRQPTPGTPAHEPQAQGRLEPTLRAFILPLPHEPESQGLLQGATETMQLFDVLQSKTAAVA